MSHSKNDLNKYKAAFNTQKSNAKRRGIDWFLTFEEWLTWWGSDIDKRGSHRDGLQMQRYGDSGPYSLDNIRKGNPRQNSATWARVAANKRAEKARKEHEDFLNALMMAESKPEKDNWVDDEHFLPPHSNGLVSLSAYPIDKNR